MGRVDARPIGYQLQETDRSFGINGHLEHSCAGFLAKAEKTRGRFTFPRHSAGEDGCIELFGFRSCTDIGALAARDHAGGMSANRPVHPAIIRPIISS
jgi:hypothetical protein